MGLRVVVPPSGEVISTADARAHCYVIGTAQDAKLATLVKAAVAHVERWCDRALLPQTWELSLDGFAACIRLTGGEVRSVESITYDDGDGAEQTLSPAVYRLDASGEPAAITLAAGASWPETSGLSGCVRIRYVVGYADAASVPEDLRAGLLLLVGDLFENRQAQQAEALNQNLAVQHLLMPFRRMLL